MKYILIGFFGGLIASMTLFMVTPSPPGKMSKEEDASYTLGLYMGLPAGLGSLVGLLSYLTLTRGY